MGDSVLGNERRLNAFQELNANKIAYPECRVPGATVLRDKSARHLLEPLRGHQIAGPIATPVRQGVQMLGPSKRRSDLAGAGTGSGTETARQGRSAVEFLGVTKSFDGYTNVVSDLDLAVQPGEFITFLGPSGSGKTTTLMLLAGFEEVSSGEILLDGQSLRGMPPHRRNIGMVFQSYALFPHLTVAENVAFPLRVRHRSKV
jgi:ABC-type multidrug transport system fused ATPase/permease subunit